MSSGGVLWFPSPVKAWVPSDDRDVKRVWVPPAAHWGWWGNREVGSLTHRKDDLKLEVVSCLSPEVWKWKRGDHVAEVTLNNTWVPHD